jgi:putative membrane protein insertion efficiency factor
VKYLFMGLIRIYQRTISPLLGPVCRYYPSCSHYGYEAMSVHGAAKGTILTGWRILRCNPWSSGGIDEVPPRGKWRNPTTTAEVDAETSGAVSSGPGRP